MNQILEDAQTLYSVDAQLTFALRDGAPPVSLPSRPGAAEGSYEGDHETRTVSITNAWPLVDGLNIDREGFNSSITKRMSIFMTMLSARLRLSAKSRH